MGKTHLMSAVGYSIAIRDKSKNMAFVTSEEFTNEMINALRFDRMVDFRNKYRKLDLLMIDDIQFIAGKEKEHKRSFFTRLIHFMRRQNKLSLHPTDFQMKYQIWKKD